MKNISFTVFRGSRVGYLIFPERQDQGVVVDAVFFSTEIMVTMTPDKKIGVYHIQEITSEGPGAFSGYCVQGESQI